MLETDKLIKLVENSVEVIAGGEEMLGIEADLEVGGRGEIGKDFGEFFQVAANRVAGGVFQKKGDVGRSVVKDPVDGGDDLAFDGGKSPPLVAADVKDGAGTADLSCEFLVGDERVNAGLDVVGAGTGEVDEIDAVEKMGSLGMFGLLFEIFFDMLWGNCGLGERTGRRGKGHESVATQISNAVE